MKTSWYYPIVDVMTVQTPQGGYRCRAVSLGSRCIIVVWSITWWLMPVAKPLETSDSATNLKQPTHSAMKVNVKGQIVLKLDRLLCDDRGTFVKRLMTHNLKAWIWHLQMHFVCSALVLNLSRCYWHSARWASTDRSNQIAAIYQQATSVQTFYLSTVMSTANMSTVNRNPTMVVIDAKERKIILCYVDEKWAGRLIVRSGDTVAPNRQLDITWWRHQMETFSALPALCEGNPPITGGFSSQRPVTRSFDVFFDLRPNKRLSK